MLPSTPSWPWWWVGGVLLSLFRYCRQLIPRMQGNAYYPDAHCQTRVERFISKSARSDPNL